MDKLLIVDDNEDIRKQLKWGLGKEYELLMAGDAGEALSVFRKNRPRVVTLDLGLPPHEDGTEEGFRCLGEMLRIAPETKIIVITGNDDKNNALLAVQSGAYDFFQKPIDITELKVIISRAFHLRRIEEENTRLQNALVTKQVGLAGIVGQSRQMQEVFATIRKVATSEVPVLIMGESGTGKEMVAQAIHQLSLRKEAPFIAINCGAIPENLLESELFGYEKGAFTSAAGRVQGKVEFAHRGTLFLDEIGELPGNLQVKLLRFLQEKQIQRVGGREDIAVDARVVCATNINMEKAIAAGSFREDLYYRIAVISVKLPPLRERGDDIHLLANLFLKRSCDQFNKKLRGFTPAAREAIETYEWPGNVRELENRVQRAVIMTEATSLDPADLGFTDWHPGYTGTKKELTLREAKERVEREMIAATIRNHQGNVAKAAEILGISRPTLYDLMRKHGIESH